MMQFDPYLSWLGIPVHEQPPTYYRLLGIVLFESNPQVIEQAANRQSAAVAANQGGPHGELCQRLLAEIAMARFNLLDPQQKAGYDAWLQQSVASRGECAVAAPPLPSAWGGLPAFPSSSQFFQPPPLPQTPLSFAQPRAQGPMPAPQPALPPPFMPPPMPQPLAGGPQGLASPGVLGGPAPGLLAPWLVGPAAARFATASAADNNAAAAPTAPPAVPPVAPLRPLEELEQLAAQPGNRPRVAKKHKSGFGKEVATVAAMVACAALMIGGYFAAQWLNRTGLGGISDGGGRNPPPSAGAKQVSEKAKPEKERKSTQEGPSRKASDRPPVLRKPAADEPDFVIKNPVSRPGQ